MGVITDSLKFSGTTINSITVNNIVSGSTVLGNSDDTLVTEYAIKNYVTTELSVSGGTNINTPGNYRVLTSDGTTKGINANQYLIFSGQTLTVDNTLEVSYIGDKFLYVNGNVATEMIQMGDIDQTQAGNYLQMDLKTNGDLTYHGTSGVEKFRIAADGTTTVKSGQFVVDNGETYLNIDSAGESASIGDIEEHSAGNFLEILWNPATLTYYGDGGVTAFSINSAGNTTIAGTLTINTMESATGSTVVYYDPTTSGLTYGTGGGGSSVSFGADNQIPYTNSTSDDFDYSANLTFTGSILYLAGILAFSGANRQIEGGIGGYDLSIYGGEHTTGGSGGNLNLYGGTSNGATGGQARLQGGEGSGTGGHVYVAGGIPASTGTGGNLYLDGGDGLGGTEGNVIIGQNYGYLQIETVPISSGIAANELIFLDVGDSFTVKRLSGALPVALGGTGLATVGTNYLLTGNGTSAMTAESNLTFDGSTLSTTASASSRFININGGDFDSDIWRIGNASGYGFYLRYNGTGSGTDNSLSLWTEGEAGTDIQAYEVKQSGAVYFGSRIYSAGLTTTSGIVGANNIDVGTTNTVTGAFRHGYFTGTVYADDAVQIGWTGANIFNLTTESTGIKSDGYLIADTYFQSSDAAVVLGTASTGSVYLRPSGILTSTGQWQFSPTVVTIDAVSSRTIKMADNTAAVDGYALNIYGSASTQDHDNPGPKKQLGYVGGDINITSGAGAPASGGVWKNSGGKGGDLNLSGGAGGAGDSSGTEGDIRLNGYQVYINSDLIDIPYRIRHQGATTTQFFGFDTTGTYMAGPANYIGESSYASSTYAYKTLNVIYNNTTTDILSYVGWNTTGEGVIIRNLSATDGTYANLDFVADSSYTTTYNAARISWKGYSTSSTLGNYMSFVMYNGSMLEQFRMTRTGDFHANGNIIAYSTTIGSDIRLKENVKTIEEDSLSKIMSLRPVTFDWKERPVDATKSSGFIAQELEKIYPDMIYESVRLGAEEGDETKYKHVRYNELIAHLTKAIQQQQQQIEEQQIEIDDLKKLIS